MNKNGRGDNRPRRRGNVQRKQCLAVIISILVVYILYKKYMPDSDGAFKLYENTHINQNRFVQGEIRTKSPGTEKNAWLNAPVSREKIAEDIQILNEDIGDDKTGVNNMNSDDIHATDDNANDDERDSEDETAPDQDKTEMKDFNTTLTKSNKAFTSGSVVKEKMLNGTIKLNMTFSNFTKENMSNGTIKLNVNFSNVTEENMSNGNIKFSMTFPNGASNIKAKDNSMLRESTAVKAYKVQLIQDFTNQTKELSDLVKDTLTKHAMNLTAVNWQNKTKALDGNVTNLIELLTFKSENVKKLAGELLFSNSVNLPHSNQENLNNLNRTNTEEAFSVESQDLIKIVNEVLSKSDKSTLETENKAQIPLLDKYAFHAQKLAKFANSIVTNTAKKVVDSEQKLINVEVPSVKNLPFANNIVNMTANGMA